MTSTDLLSIEPHELHFPSELRKQISCSLQISNNSDHYVAFKVKTTNPKKYCVRPNTGIVLPTSKCDVIVTMQAQKEAPSDLECKEKFLVQGVIASPGATPKDITPEMFSREAGHQIEEWKLRVVYVDPPRPPSPVREESEEGYSPRVSVSDNGKFFSTEQTVSRAYGGTHDAQDSSSEARALVSKLSEEKNSAIHKNMKLRQELDLLRRKSSQRSSRIPFGYVVVVGLIGFILGYLMKSTGPTGLRVIPIPDS